MSVRRKGPSAAEQLRRDLDAARAVALQEQIACGPYAALPIDKSVAYRKLKTSKTPEFEFYDISAVVYNPRDEFAFESGASDSSVYVKTKKGALQYRQAEGDPLRDVSYVKAKSSSWGSSGEIHIELYGVAGKGKDPVAIYEMKALRKDKLGVKVATFSATRLFSPDIPEVVTLEPKELLKKFLAAGTAYWVDQYYPESWGQGF